MRVQVSAAIRQCSQAGIRVIMITGDNKLTAEAIAQDVGILSSGDSFQNKSMTGVCQASTFHCAIPHGTREGGGEGGGGGTPLLAILLSVLEKFMGTDRKWFIGGDVA